MKKKRFLLLLVCLAAAIGITTTLTSCGDKDDPGQVETEKFTVTFQDPDGGTSTATQNVVKGGKATEPATPKRDDYTFAGWYSGDTKYNFDTPVTKDLVLVAKWTPNSSVEEGYTATLKYENGEANGSLKATKSGDSWFFTKPSDPTKTDHTFAGWFTEAGAEFDFTEAVTSDVVLVAHWTPNSSVEEGYTATLKYENGEANGSLKATKSGDNWFFTKPNDPTKTDHTFAGWFTEAGAEFDFTEAVTADVVLVAHWTPNSSVEEGYTATLKYENGEANGSLEATKSGDNWFFTKPNDPTKPDHTFAGWFTEAGAEFDFTEAVSSDIVLVAHWTPIVEEGFTATLVYNNGNSNGTLHTVKEYNQFYFNAPTNPTKLYNDFVCWCIDEGLETPFNFDTPITEDITLYAKWTQAFDTVKTDWDFIASAGIIQANPSGNVSLTEDMLFQGKFYLGTGARFEVGNNCINTQNKVLEFILSGDGTNNTVTFNAKWASSSTGKFQIINKDTGNVVYDSGNLAGNSAAFDASVSNLPAGQYEIKGTGSVRFYKFSLTEKLAQSPTKGIELNTATIEKNVLLGRAFSTNGLSVVLVYENGRKDVLDLANVSIASPEDFTTSAGVKTITVSYKLNDTTTYTDSYTVNVCEVSEIVYYDYVLNSSRETMNLQTLFPIGGTFNSDNLVVKAKCLLPGTTDYIEFKLNSNEYTISTPDLTTAGNKPVYLTYVRDTAISTEYDIEVVTNPNLSDRTEVTVIVNPNGDISTSGTYTVHTINQALQFFKLANVANNATKTISLMKNTIYKEKVEIDLPNVVLTTGNLTEDELTSSGGTFNYETAKAVFDLFAVIEFDALSGKLDPSETVVHSTDGSATVSIRPEAENFTAQFVTFKNYYNTNALYKESLTITTDSQAVAALVQADKAKFIACKFTSYHDTLYAQVGRQYYDQCLIEGHTDYIFGYNATAFFENSLIHSIGAGTEASGNGNYNNGGYVVATKGFNKATETDGIEYGYIFNNCEFTADDATANGSVSIARGWGDNMKIMVMNSTLSAHYSKEAYGEVTATGKNMNDRYGKMNAAPNASNLLEYNNTGDGAIQASLSDTCTVFTTATEAEKYADLNTVFGVKNGKLVNNEPWNPVQDKDASVTVLNEDGTENVVYENISWVGSTVVESQLASSLVIPNKQKLAGFYSDQELTTPYNFDTKLQETNTVYVKFDDDSKLAASSTTSDDPIDATTKAWGATGILTLIDGSKEWSVETNSKPIKKVDGTDYSTNNRLKSNGTGQKIEINLSEFSGKATIEVWAITGSSSALNRGFKISDASGTQLGSNYICDSTNIKNFVINLDCGQKYTLEVVVGAINFYGINIKPAA